MTSTRNVDSGNVMVVDDEPTIRRALERKLTKKGCRVRAAASAEEAWELVQVEEPAVLLLDIVLPGMSGLELLVEIKKTHPDTEVLILTSHGSLETAISAIRSGAYDYLVKPFEDLEDVWIRVQRALERRDLSLSNRTLLDEKENRNQELADSVARLRTMVEASRVMSEFFSTRELLDYFIHVVTENLQVDRASIMLLDDTGEHLTIAAHRGIDDFEPDAVRVRLGEGISGDVALTGRPYFVSSAAEDPRPAERRKPNLADSFISAPIVLSIPLKSSRRVQGVVNLTDRRDGKCFTSEDSDFITTLSSLLALAIEKTRQIEALERANDKLVATQQQLVFAERLKAMGQLAAGVAHDINNALGVISARSEFILEGLTDPSVDVEKVRSHAMSISSTTRSAAETIKRIQDYTRIRRDNANDVIDLNEVVNNAVEMTRPKWKEEFAADGRAIDIVSDLGEQAFVRGNFGELTQLVSNLILNGLEAMPDGGELGFRTRRDGEKVLLFVRDNGMGMPEEIRDRLFEPFFTTKETGHGLGTSVAYGIMSRHGGEITVHSASGEGTAFRLEFPAGPTALDSENDGPGETPSSHVSARVLVCDDDDKVRDVLEDALTSHGHDVVGVASGQEAFRRFSADEFDVVITDLSMPGMSGLDLTKRLKSERASTPVVLLSGWAVQQDEERVRAAGVDRVLGKPFLIEDLLQVVDDLTRDVLGT